MTQVDEAAAIERWAALVQSRRGLIGATPAAGTGEEFTTSGDLALDAFVASVVLDSIQKRLPSYSWTGPDDVVQFGRGIRPAQVRKVQLLPCHLFSIDWARTAPGLSWPQSYYVTHVPSINRRIVTASMDDSEIWGYPDLAIGLCPAVRSPDFGTKKVIQSWWRRASGCEAEGWEVFWAAGLIDKGRAQQWKKEVFGSRPRY